MPGYFCGCFRVSRNIGGNQDVFHPQLSTNPCNIAPGKVVYHTPIIGESDRIELQNIFGDMQGMGTVSPPAVRNDAIVAPSARR